MKYDCLLTREELNKELESLIESIKCTYEKSDCDEDRQCLIEALNSSLKNCFYSNEIYNIKKKHSWFRDKMFHNTSLQISDSTDFDITMDILRVLSEIDTIDDYLSELMRAGFDNKGIIFLSDDIKKVLFYIRQQCLFIMSQPTSYKRIAEILIGQIDCVMKQKYYIQECSLSNNYLLGKVLSNFKVNTLAFLNEMRNKRELTNKDRKKICEKYILICRRLGLIPLIGKENSEVLRTYGLVEGPADQEIYREIIDTSILYLTKGVTYPCSVAPHNISMYRKSWLSREQEYDMQFFIERLQDNVSPMHLAYYVDEETLLKLIEESKSIKDNIINTYLNDILLSKHNIEENNIKVQPKEIYKETWGNTLWDIHFKLLTVPVTTGLHYKNQLIGYVETLNGIYNLRDDKDLKELIDSLTTNNGFHNEYKNIFSQSDFYRAVRIIDKVIRKHLIK